VAVVLYSDSVFGLPCQVGKGQSGSIAAVISKRKIPGGPNVFLDIAGLDQPEGTWPVLVENQATASQFYAVVGTEGDLVCAQGTYRILLESVEGGDAWVDSPRVLTLKAYILAWSGVAPPSDADTTQLIDFAWGNGEDYLVTFYPTATKDAVDQVDIEWGDGAIETLTGPFASTAIPSADHTYDGPGPWVVTMSALTDGVRTGDVSKLVTASRRAPVPLLVAFDWADLGGFTATFQATATGEVPIDTVDWFWSDGQQTTQTGPFADPAALPTVEHTFDVDDPAVGSGRWVVYVSVTAGGVTSSRASDLVTVTGA
jgi:hypothetical protein